MLVGNEHDQVVGERPAHPFELLPLGDRDEVDPGDDGAQRAGDSFHFEALPRGCGHG